MKQLIAVIAATLAFAVSAQTITVTGSAGITSNATYRGVSVSDQKPAATVDVVAKLNLGPVYVFGGINGSTANINDLRAVANAEAGAGLTVKQVNVEAGARHRMHFGSATGYNPSDLNYDEAFVRAKAPLFLGKAYVEANKTFTTASLVPTTQYYVVGYTQDFGTVTAYAQGAFGSIGSYTKVKASNAEVGLSFPVTKQLSVGANYIFGANGNKNQGALLASYKF